jgi:CheY-like chemotaxis protein
MPTRHVLIIDDEPDIRDTLAEIVKLEGYSVATARNGLDGLESARARRPSVIVLDLMMPVMNGWEFRDAQLAEPELAHVPVIVMSAAPAGSHFDAATILTKPFPVHDLLKAISRHSR